MDLESLRTGFENLFADRNMKNAQRPFSEKLRVGIACSFLLTSVVLLGLTIAGVTELRPVDALSYGVLFVAAFRLGIILTRNQ